MQLEGDCSQVIKAIQDRVEDPCLPFDSICDEIFQLSSSFHSFSCSHVKRMGNRLAHALARFISLSTNVSEAYALPAELATII